MNQRGKYDRRWRKVRAAVLAASDVCWICGRPGANSVDHVQSLATGGARLDPANLRPAHVSCNSRKGAMGDKLPPKHSRRW